MLVKIKNINGVNRADTAKSKLMNWKTAVFN